MFAHMRLVPEGICYCAPRSTNLPVPLQNYQPTFQAVSILSIKLTLTSYCATG